MQPDCFRIFRPSWPWLGFPIGSFVSGWLMDGRMPWYYWEPGNWLAYLVILIVFLDCLDTVYKTYFRPVSDINYAAYYDAHFVRLGNGYMHKDDYANLSPEQIDEIEKTAAIEREAKEKADAEKKLDRSVN